MQHFILRNPSTADTWISQIVRVSDSTYSRLKEILPGLTAPESIALFANLPNRQDRGALTAAVRMAGEDAIWSRDATARQQRRATRYHARTLERK